jgi:hypothetical protein
MSDKKILITVSLRALLFGMQEVIAEPPTAQLVTTRAVLSSERVKFPIKAVN